jgi:hypothetical protein
VLASTRTARLDSCDSYNTPPGRPAFQELFSRSSQLAISGRPDNTRSAKKSRRVGKDPRIGATGVWSGGGLLDPEAFDPVPLLDLLKRDYDSPWGMEER